MNKKNQRHKGFPCDVDIFLIITTNISFLFQRKKYCAQILNKDLSIAKIFGI